MTNTKTTKKALVASVFSLLLCVSMLIGSTFAWFTDTASTSVNKIQAGKLDIGFMMKEGDSWVNAEGKSLNFVKADAAPAGEEILWEPGATYELPAVQLVNNGNLALKFKLFINGVAGGDMKLAEVLEVVMNGQALTKADGSAVTLKDLMADSDGAAHGVLLPKDATVPAGADTNYVKVEKSAEITIALHMAEEAGNQYQELSINGITLTAYATQYTFEYDSTDNQYDATAEYEMVPAASIAEIPAADRSIDVKVNGASNTTAKTLDAGFVFTATETYEEAKTSEYAKWHAEFVVSADKDIPANAMGLAGNYAQYGWVSLESNTAIAQGTEISLLQTLLNGGTMNYEEVCQYASTFKCGVYENNSAVTDGTTITVELRLYEVEGTSTSSIDSRTGKYVTIGTYTYTF